MEGVAGGECVLGAMQWGSGGMNRVLGRGGVVVVVEAEEKWRPWISWR